MTSGGARNRSGPPPDPMALRRDRKSDGEWTTLPATGRIGETPAWPLTVATGRETEWWLQLWAKPQALMWERAGQHVEVALYVRRLTEAEKPESSTALNTLVRQMADALGLTIPGMRVNRWKIAVDQVEQKRTERAAAAEANAGPAAPGEESARDRFRPQVVRGKAG